MEKTKLYNVTAGLCADCNAYKSQEILLVSLLVICTIAYIYFFMKEKKKDATPKWGRSSKVFFTFFIATIYFVFAFILSEASSSDHNFLIVGAGFISIGLIIALCATAADYVLQRILQALRKK